MNLSHARGLLQRMLGPGAEFREGQWEAIERVAIRKERLLVVQRTGWGKSVVYFLATRILRDAGAGPTLLVSPLLALMRNQLLAAEKLGIQAATIHSENQEEWESVERSLRAGEVDLLMLSPERLGNVRFLNELLPAIQGSIGLFVVDEAHCISDWGHDFRPDYRRIVRILRLLPAAVPVLCTTATANERVVRDIESQIERLGVLRGPLVRHSLRLFTIQLHDQAERLAWLAHFLPKLPGSGIVYTLTIQDARRVAAWLMSRGITARPYHADLTGPERVEIEGQLLRNELKALVATVALGMGYDKPDLGFVVHFQRPGSVVAYYQQVGRAGRAVESAFGILLSGAEDDEIQEYFIQTAFPPLEVMTGVLECLEKSGDMTVAQLGMALNRGRTMIEKALRLLEVEGAVAREGSVYNRSANRWVPDTQRYEQVRRLRRAELAEIKRYVQHRGCLMEFLSRALDDPAAAPCGKCMNCAGKIERRSAPADLTQDAVRFLQADHLVLEPRERWPGPLLEEIAKLHPGAVGAAQRNRSRLVSTLPDCVRAEPPLALCIWGDAGWGPEVARGKYEHGAFSDPLVGAMADLVRRHRPDLVLPGSWVTAVPSLHRPSLVPDFARKLALNLGLPFHGCIVKLRQTRPQKEMHDSAQQLRNVLAAFEIHGPVPGGPVLLIDDVIDSRWTVTLLAAMLRLQGSGPVQPLALAKASPKGS